MRFRFQNFKISAIGGNIRKNNKIIHVEVIAFALTFLCPSDLHKMTLCFSNKDVTVGAD